jgi:hypothetical protein
MMYEITESPLQECSATVFAVATSASGAREHNTRILPECPPEGRDGP